MNWNEKKKLDLNKLYENDDRSDGYIYFDDMTAIKKTEKSIAYYKLENPYSVDYPIVKWVKTLHREDGPAIEWYNATKEWYKNGKLHREDGPATITCNGCETWFKNGVKHREGGPAVYMNNDNGEFQEWHINGILHREDGPATINRRTSSWYKNGKLHRDGNLPATISLYDGGDYLELYYVDGILHRTDGPAKIDKNYLSTVSYWYNNGKKHREDGPAYIEEMGGKIYKRYYVNDKKICKLRFNLFYKKK